MKKLLILFTFITALCSSCGSDHKIDLLGPVDFGDINLWEFCVRNYDTDKDGWLSLEEAKAVKTIMFGGILSSLKGIEYFTELTQFEFKWTTDTLDISNHPQIKSLYIYGDIEQTNLKELFFAQDTELEELYLSHVDLRKLDFSSCKKLKKVWIELSGLLELDFSNCPEMEELSLKNFAYDFNLSGEIDLSNCTKLKKLEFNFAYGVKELDLSDCVELEFLLLNGCSLSEIDISHNRKLKQFRNINYHLDELIVYVWSGHKDISYLCGACKLVEVD